MNRRFRAHAFAAAGVLLLVAPATMAFAMSPTRFQPPYVFNLSVDSLHDAKARQMTLADAAQDARSEALQGLVTQPIVNSTRYAGKQVPI